MDALNHRLACIEELCLRPLYLSHKTIRQILHHNPVGAGKEANNILNKVTLILTQLLPLSYVLAQINLLRHPEHRHVLLVTIPDILVLNGKDGESVL